MIDRSRLVADSCDLDAALLALAEQRPVFHSEADFQHHLAWHLHVMEPSLRVRLEVRPDPAVREAVDLLVSRPGGAGTAIELKYLKAAWQGVVGDEPFTLLNQGAHDISRYDVVKDIARVERFVSLRPGWNGFAITLTNDAMYWREPAFPRATVDRQFRIHEGVVLAGERSWEGAGPGTMRGRAEAIQLAGTYPLSWSDYRRFGSGRNGEFRLLVVPVPSPAA